MTNQLALTERSNGTEASQIAPIQDVGGLLTLAIDKGVTPEGLSKLLDLQERILQRNAEAEFNQAMQDFQSRCPSIQHDRKGHQSTYATLPQIARTIGPLLADLGLSYTFDAEFISEATDLGEGKSVERSYIRAVCTVHHVAGHRRSATFQSPIDKQSKMNVMQQSASALTYARRYALTLALGLTTTDCDDDGAGSGRVQSDSPQANANAPRAQPRGGRVQQNEVDDLKKRWASIFGSGLSKEEMRSEFCRWAFQKGGVPNGRADQLSAWTRDAIKSCTMALDEEEREVFGGSEP